MTTIGEHYDDGRLSKSDLQSNNRYPNEATNRTNEQPGSNTNSSRYTMHTAQMKHDYGNNVVLVPKDHDVKTRPAMNIKENHVVKEEPVQKRQRSRSGN